MQTKTKPVIPPSIGRRVLLFIGGTAGYNNPAVPFDAGIAYVHGASDPQKNLINTGYVDHAGLAGSATSVALHDRAQTTSDNHGTGETYAVWMPYQFDQALRALEPKPVAPERPADVELKKLEEPAGVELSDDIDMEASD